MSRRSVFVALTALMLTACSAGTPSKAPTTTSTTGSPTPTSALVVPGDPWIIYQWIEGSGDGIKLMRPDGTATHSVRGPWSGTAYHPDWSPDGSQVTFEWRRSTGADIVVANPDGSSHAVVATNLGCGDGCNDWPVTPAWSPDGASIAYTRISDDGATVVAATLEVVNLASGVSRTVYTAPLDTVLNYPRWSPDGTKIVFESTTYDYSIGPIESVIWLIDVAASGAEPTALTDPAMFATYPDWHPTEQLILFTTYDLAEFQQTDEPSNLYTIRPDGSDLTKLTTFGDADRRATQPSWTSDGLRIIFTMVENAPGDFDFPRRVALVDRDGGSLEVLDAEGTHPRLRPVR